MKTSRVNVWSAGVHLKPLSAVCSAAWDALSTAPLSACRSVLRRKLSDDGRKKKYREGDSREEAVRRLEQLNSDSAE